MTGIDAAMIERRRKLLGSALDFLNSPLTLGNINKHPLIIPYPASLVTDDVHIFKYRNGCPILALQDYLYIP